MKYYKFISPRYPKEDGLDLKEGLNVDPRALFPGEDTLSGCISFSREDILCYLGIGTHICVVTPPEDALLFENTESPRTWRAPSVVLGKWRKITPRLLRELIKEGADVNANGGEPLVMACMLDSTEFPKATEIVKLLIRSGADITARDGQAFKRAILSRNTELVKVFLDAGIIGSDMHVGFETSHFPATFPPTIFESAWYDQASESSPMSVVIGGGQEDMINLFLKYLNKDTVEWLANTQSLEFVYAAVFKRFAELGNLKALKAISPPWVSTQREAFQLAAKYGHLPVMKYLYDQIVFSEVSETSLLVAVKSGQFDAVHQLLAWGASHGVSSHGTGCCGVQWETNVASIPLVCAVEGGHTEIVKLLLDHGASPCVGGDWPLIVAANRGYEDLVALFLAKGADPRAQDNAAVRLAADENHMDIVKMLMDHWPEKKIVKIKQNSSLEKWFKDHDELCLRNLSDTQIVVSFNMPTGGTEHFVIPTGDVPLNISALFPQQVLLDSTDLRKLLYRQPPILQMVD